MNHNCKKMSEKYQVILWQHSETSIVKWAVIEKCVDRQYMVNGITHCPFCGEKLPEIPEKFVK